MDFLNLQFLSELEQLRPPGRDGSLARAMKWRGIGFGSFGFRKEARQITSVTRAKTLSDLNRRKNMGGESGELGEKKVTRRAARHLGLLLFLPLVCKDRSLPVKTAHPTCQSNVIDVFGFSFSFRFIAIMSFSCFHNNKSPHVSLS